MVVAMVAVRMVEVSIHQIIDMVAVRHGLVTAIGPVDMTRVVPGAVMIGRADVGIRCGHCQDMFVDVISMHMMQMTIMQVVDVPVVIDREMSAAGAMLMNMVFVFRASAHADRSSFECARRAKGFSPCIDRVHVWPHVPLNCATRSAIVKPGGLFPLDRANAT
jgi:hypothetical protein